MRTRFDGTDAAQQQESSPRRRGPIRRSRRETISGDDIRHFAEFRCDNSHTGYGLPPSRSDQNQVASWFETDCHSRRRTASRSLSSGHAFARPVGSLCNPPHHEGVKIALVAKLFEGLDESWLVLRRAEKHTLAEYAALPPRALNPARDTADDNIVLGHNALARRGNPPPLTSTIN
jgi:hypothetical protein